MVGINPSHFCIIDVLFGIKKVERRFLSELEFIVDSFGNEAQRLQLRLDSCELCAGGTLDDAVYKTLLRKTKDTSAVLDGAAKDLEVEESPEKPRVVGEKYGFGAGGASASKRPRL